MAVKLTIVSRSGRDIGSFTVDPKDTVKDLKKQFHAANKKYYPARQRFELPAAPGEKRGVALADESKSLEAYGVKGDTTLTFKDLGTQIGYSTVFFWEYFGPLAIYPLFYFFPNVFYPWADSTPRHLVQTLAVAYWSFHYAKRIAETYLVHRFGHATMPIFNLFRNCAYYWGFAAFVSYFVNHPMYTAPNEVMSQAIFAFCMACQLGNFWCHHILANLRKPGEKEYKIPSGFLFDYITCANYTCEIMGWVGYTIATFSLPAAVFTAAGGFQMAQWALQKHIRLIKTFDGKEGRAKYPRRWIMMPPFF